MYRNCAFCSAKVIRVRIHTTERRGKIRERIMVDGGVLVGKSKGSMLPVCDDCWEKAVQYLKENFDPIGKLMVRGK